MGAGKVQREKRAGKIEVGERRIQVASVGKRKKESKVTER
jgi:hypothetical protein